MNVLLLLVILVVMRGPAAALADRMTCPGKPGWEWTEGRFSDGIVRCYKMSSQLLTFTACQEQVCGPWGGTLACVRTEEENQFVADMVRNMSHTNRMHWGAWIGFHEGLGQGHWSWTSTCGSDYTAWRDGREPDDPCVAEDCALLSPRSWGADWADAECEVEAVCLCEHGTDVAPEYTEEVIQALRDGGGAEGYEACQEEAKDGRSVRRQVHGWMSFQTVLLIMVLGLNLAVLGVALAVYQRQWAWSRPMDKEQQLAPFGTPLMTAEDEA